LSCWQCCCHGDVCGGGVNWLKCADTWWLHYRN
jgi:hypothetical protein